MVTEAGPDLPSGKELKARWADLSRPAQGALWRKIRTGETSEDRNDAFLIAAMAKQRLRDWTMRPEIILPIFLAFLFLLSLVMENFSFESSLSTPVVYALYMLWMRSRYKRAYRRSMETLTGRVPRDV